MSAPHVPVMLPEVLEALATHKRQVVYTTFQGGPALALTPGAAVPGVRQGACPQARTTTCAG